MKNLQLVLILINKWRLRFQLERDANIFFITHIGVMHECG